MTSFRCGEKKCYSFTVKRSNSTVVSNFFLVKYRYNRKWNLLIIVYTQEFSHHANYITIIDLISLYIRPILILMQLELQYTDRSASWTLCIWFAIDANVSIVAIYATWKSIMNSIWSRFLWGCDEWYAHFMCVFLNWNEWCGWSSDSISAILSHLQSGRVFIVSVVYGWLHSAANLK